MINNVQKGSGPFWTLADVDDGAKGDRTPDLLAASQTLSQLSYGPVSSAR